MELVRWEPFMNFGNLQSVLNDWFEADGVSTQSRTSKWHPAVDVLEGKDAYLIHAELPGIKKEDIHAYRAFKLDCVQLS